MSEAPFVCTINNLAYDEMRPQSTDLPLGRWVVYPEVIPGRKKAEEIEVIRQTRSPYVRGLVVYQVGSDESAWVKIGWDMPGVPGTTNIVNVETSHPEIIATLDGFIGLNETESITVTVVDAREQPTRNGNGPGKSADG
ncbi:hypothetical protein [Streptomyces halobius]|uniref:Uncharacterized protein n=1 Tax=Streptomyces halobius TaxID=2879846 RepID=A0ABY4M2T4_9ACTN|nr:hypothetical protein [Streptomyces halobius]UQA92052.1 hypothetical protein K9S39_09515 [Streptomyces halobius]